MLANAVSRIIPARAGFTHRRSRALLELQDHPRSRGVYAYSYKLSVTSDGSSPLARGLRRKSRHTRRIIRIIPARAGFTPDWTCISIISGDHPRSRGVYGELDFNSPSRSGSSPLARGLRGDSQNGGEDCGIIPARAGFTEEIARRQDRLAGSSPLARGLLPRPTLIDMDRRIIPARAGFTDNAGSNPVRRKDHPRSRGVYMAYKSVLETCWGSSPLARGLPV